MLGTTTLLAVSTLGKFEIRREAELLTGGNWNRRKVCDLFKVLLSADQHRLHREQIQEMLWPTATIEQAANSFGKTLYLLRRALEPELVAGKGSSSVYVLLEHDTLMLVPQSIEIDADQFEAAAKPLQAAMRSRTTKEQDKASTVQLLEQFDAVLALYKGDYLPEDIYEDWSQRRRDRLRRLYSWLLENAAELAVAYGQGQRACEYLQALLERNSADEQTHQQLMQVYARMGRRSEALNQYQLLRQVLREELHAQPLAETTELYRKIQAGRITTDLIEVQPAVDTSVGAALSTHQFIAHTSAATPSSPTPPTAPQPSREPVITSPLPVLAPQEAEKEANTQSQVDPERILKAGLVGRETETATIQRAYQQACLGQRKAGFIAGEPGIGKTRLAAEFAHWAEETEAATVLWGYCYEMSGSFPYQPIADAINTHVRTCTPEQLRSMLGQGAADLAKIAPEVRLKLPDLGQPEAIGAEMERRNLYNAVARYLTALAVERPLIVLLDDLQWADAATIQLLTFLLMQSTDATPLGNTGGSSYRKPLYLLPYRPDEVHEAHPLRGLMTTLARANISTEVRLRRLTEEQVWQLLVSIAGHDVRPVFAAEIYRQTEGNPFFIGEAIRSLVFEGKVKKVGDRWQATVDVNNLEIPHSVRLLIERRLVKLAPECRTTLVLAAVLGRQFSSELLCQARNLSEEAVAEHLDVAIAAQLISSLSDTPQSDFTQVVSRQESSSVEAEVDLAFTHDKIREVLYQWLNPLRRRTLHRQVAQAIEARYAARLQPYYSRLAYHYQMAENATRAIDYLLKAAQHAGSVYAFVNVAEYMKTALDLLIGDEERPMRAGLLRQLSDIYIYTGRIDKAIEAGMASAALWRDLGDEAKQAEAYLYVAFCLHWQEREAESVEYIQRALQCIKDRPEETALFAKAYTQWGMAATVMGDAPLAREKLAQGDALHAQIGGNDPFITVVSLWSRCWYALLVESPQQMLDYALQGAEACIRLRKPEWEPMMSYSAAWAYMLLGQLKEGQHKADEALKKAQQHGVVGAQGWAHLVKAFVAIQAGSWEEVATNADNAYAIATMLQNADLQARVLWSRSASAGWQGNWEQAITDIEEAMRMAQLYGEMSMVFPHLLVQAAKAYFFAGKIDEAQRYVDQAMELGKSRHYRQVPAMVQRLQGRIWQEQHRFEQAQPCFERSLAELQALDDMVEYARTQEAYAYFYFARKGEGDEARGKELLHTAQETFNRLGVNG